MLDQARSACAARPDDHVDDALWDSRLERDRLEAQGAQRSQLGRLENHRVAGGKCGGELPRCDREGKVPGGDQADNAERLTDRPRLTARDRDRVPQQPLGGAGVVAEGVDDHRDLSARVSDRLTGVARLEHGEPLELVLQRVRQLAQPRRTRAGGERAPCRMGLARAGDRRVHLGDPGARNPLEHRLGGGLDH
jgi:hypothetical protein